jgi:hypothetical protein
LLMSFFCTIFVLPCSMQLIYYVMKRKIIVSSKTLKFRNALRDVCKAKRKEMTNLIIQLLDIVDDYYQGNAIVSPSELLNHIGLDASYEDDLIHLYNLNHS